MSDSTTSSMAQGALAGSALGPWGALAGGVLGGIMGAKEKKNQDRTRKENAMINMYSPLFGQSPQALGAREDTTTLGALQGLMSGYQFGRSVSPNDVQGFKNIFGSADPNTTQAVPNAGEYVPYIQQAPGQSAVPQNFTPQFGLPFNPYVRG